MKRRLFGLLSLVLICANEGKTEALQPIPTQKSWLAIKNHDIDNSGGRIFRKYSFIQAYSENKFFNIINFNCSANPAIKASSFGIEVPEKFSIDSFPRTSKQPRLVLSLSTDDNLPVLVPASYYNNELYFEWTKQTDDVVMKIMNSQKLTLTFGTKNDTLGFVFLEGVDRAFEQVAGSLTPKMTYTKYGHAATSSVLDACLNYQKNKSESIGALAQGLLSKDLETVVKTYRDNEARFKRDFVGKRFSDVVPFMEAKEDIFSQGKFRIGFGNGKIISDVDCIVSSERAISEIANWNKGDQVKVEGVITDVIMGSVKLGNCKITK